MKLYDSGEGVIMEKDLSINYQEESLFERGFSTEMIVFNSLLVLLMVAGFVVYLSDASISYTTNFLAFSILIFNLAALIKVRHNKFALLVVLQFAFYNYSIVQAEYLAENYQLMMNELRVLENGFYYSKTLLFFYLFNAIFAIFLDRLPGISRAFKYQTQIGNSLIFYPLLGIIFIIGTFFGGSLSDQGLYEIGVSAIYEYSYMLFVYLFFFAGENKMKNILAMLAAAYIILNELAIGGRITTVQVVFVILMMIVLPRLTTFKIILFGGIGLVLMNMIGAFRGNTQDASILVTLEQMFDSLFINNTSVFAYSSSVTHVAAADYFTDAQGIQSFIGFLSYVFLGSNGIWVEYSDVTDLSNTVFPNVGGGIYFSHFYFWGGILGVILSAFFLVYLFNKLLGKYSENSQLLNFIAIFFVASSSRWYLYSPLQIFRATFFFGTVSYLLFMFVDRFVRFESTEE